MSFSDVNIAEIEYLNSPSTGSKPDPIESLTRCKLSFSTHADCNSCGSVRNKTATISWYPYERRLDKYKIRKSWYTPGNSLIEVVFGTGIQAIHEARPVAFHGHISSLQCLSLSDLVRHLQIHWTHPRDIERNYDLCQDRSAVRLGVGVSLPLASLSEIFDQLRVLCLIHSIVLACTIDGLNHMV